MLLKNIARRLLRFQRGGPGFLVRFGPRRSGLFSLFQDACENQAQCQILAVDLYNLHETHITMTRLNVSKAREELPEILNRAAYGKERTIVSRRGKDLAAVVPMEDLRLLERLARKETDRMDLEDAIAALREADEKGTISLRDLVRELGD